MRELGRGYKEKSPWYRNPLIIGLVIVSVGWFAWITKVGVMSEGKASDADVRIADTEIKGTIKSLNDKIDSLHSGISDIKDSLKDHEDKQDVQNDKRDKQVEKIYDILVGIAKDTKATDREKVENKAKEKKAPEKFPAIKTK